MTNAGTVERVYDIARLYKQIEEFESKGVSAGATRVSFAYYKRAKVRECNTRLTASKLFKDADGMIRSHSLHFTLDTRNNKELDALMKALILEIPRHMSNFYTTTYFNVKRIIKKLEPAIERKVFIDCILADLSLFQA